MPNLILNELQWASSYIVRFDRVCVCVSFIRRANENPCEFHENKYERNRSAHFEFRRLACWFGMIYGNDWRTDQHTTYIQSDHERSDHIHNAHFHH